MPTAGVKVLVIGKPFPLPYDVRHIPGTASVMGSVAEFSPDVIVTSDFQPGSLLRAPFDVRKRWIHVPPDSKPGAVIQAVEGCYASNIFNEHPGQKANPLISIYTPSYNTGDYLREAFASLREQTYSNWEWVVADDSSDDGTWERLVAMAKEDYRVRPFRSGKRVGKIGAMKGMASRLCDGEFLVELDHDDMLTDFALEEVLKAFRANPDAGFAYSNYSAFFEDGQFHRFNDDFWKGRYRETEYRGKKWLECVQPNYDDRVGPHFTQQYAWHLTLSPHHMKAFRASTFRELGGYNQKMPIADDWDLMARFYLRSKCVHIDRMCYLYRVRDAWGNTTFTRNKSIQDHLALGRAHRAVEFEAVNARRLQAQAPAPAPVPPEARATAEGADEPCFVVATRTQQEADAVLARLGNLPALVVTGASGILDVYEAGRLRWTGRRRIVYVHDDVEFRDLERFLSAVRELPPGTHGVCGSAAPDALEKGPWWDSPPLVGKYVQAFPSGGEKAVEWPGAEKAQEVTWLDGLCLVTVDQKWSWKVEGDPKIWHGYDWLACKRTREAGGKCLTIPQPSAALLAHRGYGRTEGYEEAVKALRKAEAPPTAADIGFVVLDATGGEMAGRCLASIREHAKDAEIVLVGNGVQPSKEATALADKVVLLESNLGFAAGANRGAMEVSRRLVCFMNDDAVFVDATPDKLAAAVGPTSSIVGPYSNRAKPPQGDIPREAVPAKSAPVPMVVGLCMVMPTALFHSLGGFDARLSTWEDDDLCLRAAVYGHRAMVVGGTWVDHERHASFKALGIDVQRVMMENWQKFAAKNPRIRVVAIAKDEEAAIGGYLDQFRSVTGDFCILDTGSTDRTAAVARERGARVASATFEDFAQARNEALRLFSDGVDWIIMLDPDERLDSHTIAYLRELLARTPHDIFLAPLDAVQADGRRRAFVPKPFVFRARPEIRWTFKVHEKLVGSHRQAMVWNAKIEHMIALHEDGRRGKAEGLYRALADKEPYFTDPAFRAKMRQEWPILDYDRMNDERISKTHVGALVSVVVPTFKRPELLEKAVVSALAQDYANLEVVVVGDACPQLDGLLKSAFRDPRVRVLNLPSNHGSGGAEPRNYGLMLSAGGLIAYLDDDNSLAPDHISSLYTAMQDAGASWAFSSMMACGKDLGFTEPKKGSVDTSCVLHRKDLVLKHGWWKDRVAAGYAHDWEFFSRWVAAGEPWAATRKPTLVYNVETCGQKDFMEALAAKA